ncbi:MAG TPA: HupE/UreJ family protein [Kofleriaceae bacterium]|nr:HupE/UreJ family protein [Kofleriaceae bacterium]
MIRGLTILFFVATTTPAFAHKPSDAHLRLDVDGDQLVGRLDVSVRDLDAAISIDDGDGGLTWGELEAAAPRTREYIASRLGFGPGCALTQGDPSLLDLSDGAYWSTPLTVHCAPRTLSIAYSLFFDIDAQHRGLVHLGSQTLIVRDAAPVTAQLGNTTSLATFVREGVWHIWIGIDHILFLVCLILPAVWPSGGRKTLRDVCVEVFEIVTAFTLAHSITLVISAVGLFTLPSRFVETAIALSVVAAAVNNLVRAIDARWAVAFALGLLHGFGFSSVLIDLGLPSRELIGALLGFNIGVELGQAAIVVTLIPLLYWIRNTFAYRALLFAGSGAVAVLASIWTYQRFVL